MLVICEGCGQRVPIPQGYRRNKIQCACGVICPVPEAARQGSEVPTAKPVEAESNTVEKEAERWLLEEPHLASSASESLPFPNPEPPTPASVSTPMQKPAVVEMRFPCRRCRRLIRRQGECPDCDGVAPSQTEIGNPEPVWWPSVDEPSAQDEEEDSSPYAVQGADEVKCPKCCFLLPPGSVLCVRCGFHLKKRKKIARAYQPIERVWETTASYRTRLTVFCLCEVFFGFLGLLGVFWGGANFPAVIGGFLLLTAMLAFLLGTFDRIDLKRDTRGRVQLTKTWRVAFFALPPRSIDVRSYEGIVSGRYREISVWEYGLFLLLLFCGIIPGLIWWYLTIYKVTFHVSLSRDHGYPAYILYAGWDEMQMKEIAYTLRDAARLPYHEG